LAQNEKTGFTAIRARIGMESAGISIIIGAIAILLTLVTFRADDLSVILGASQPVHNVLGVVGAHLADLLLYLFGILAYELALLLAWSGIRITIGRTFSLSLKDWGVLGLHMMSLGVVIYALTPGQVMSHSPAGLMGRLPGTVLVALFSRTGAVILGTAAAIISVFYVTRISMVGLLIKAWFAFRGVFAHKKAVMDVSESIDKTSDISKATGKSKTANQPANTFTTEKERQMANIITGKLEKEQAFENAKEPNPGQISNTSENPFLTEPVKEGLESDQSKDSDNSSKRAGQTPKRTAISDGPIIKERFVQSEMPSVGSLGLEQAGYELPPLSLLEYIPQKSSAMNADTYTENAGTLEKKLKNYKVEGRVTEIHPGPVVTMYEFKPAPGVKISQISNLSDDLAMALHALSVRIVAPLPGKGVIGVEVPNDSRETVYLRDILGSDVFRKSKSKLTMALGKDIVGKPIVTDLAKLPHLLISGATGSGKSVALNAMLLSILYKASPEDIRIILVDPKVVELQIFEGIPHLLLPVVYDAKHAAQALKWAVGEMERRYELLAKYGVRNIDSFNQLVKKVENSEDIPYNPTNKASDPDEMEHMPAIIIVVDEFADLMMVASKDVEASVARLAQKARAAGIHLIMATQRPSKDVVTGLIKANFPARISFRVSSKVDSRIVLDQNGAESLLGYGDMLFLKPGTSILQRVHGAYTSEDDVKRVTNAWRAQGEPDYEMDILRSDDEDAVIDPKELDPLIEEAREIVLESKRASISYLQRRLKVGYNRSARMMEQLERLGIVGPPDHKGEREILE